MKRVCVAVALLLFATVGARAEGPLTGGGLKIATADARYCQLAGCTMTGTFLLPNGSGATPSGSFANFPTFGLYAETGFLDATSGESAFRVMAQTAPPTALTTALVLIAGNVDSGSHSYKVTYVTATGETEGGTTSNAVTNDGTHQQNTLTAVPLSAFPNVTQRKIYRNKVADQTHWFLQQTIANNTATSGVQDNTADAGLGAAMPTTNSTIDARTTFANDGSVTMTNGIVFNGTTVKAGGANILNIANGTNAQSLRVYNTDDGAGNADFATFDFSTSANVLTIGTAKTGTGTQRAINFNSSGNISLQVAGTTKWFFSGSAGNALTPNAANSFDLGSTSTGVRTAYVSTSIQGSSTKTLTETSATGFVTVAIPNSGGCAGYVDYTVFAADATNTQLVSGQLFFSAAATSGGTVTAAAVSDQHTMNPVTSGTLTNTMTQTTGANLITMLSNATSSLTQTTLEIRYRVMLQGGTCTVTGL